MCLSVCLSVHGHRSALGRFSADVNLMFLFFYVIGYSKRIQMQTDIFTLTGRVSVAVMLSGRGAIVFFLQ